MISDGLLLDWETLANYITLKPTEAKSIMLQLIAEVRRLREQLKPDCVNGCIIKQVRKRIAEEAK